MRSFKGGRDLRLGQFAGKQKDRFKVLTNYFTDKNGHLRRRPPVKQVTGTISANAQGMIILNGVLCQIAKYGDTVTNTVVSPAITTLRFDNPSNCTTWQLIQAKVFNGKVVALIRHAYPGGVVTSRIFLHVFDGSSVTLNKKPTYVEDPYCPTSWAPTLPLHNYRTGTAGSFLDYNPRMCIAGSKLYISGPDGNLYFSRVKNARAWNTRTQQELIDNGEWWYFISTATVGQQTFLISEDYSRLASIKNWGGWVLEYLDTTGTWKECKEVAAIVGDKDYTVTSNGAGWVDQAFIDSIKVTVNWAALGAGVILRFRMCVKTSTVTTGLTWDVSDYADYFNGDGVTTSFAGSATLAGIANVYVNGVLVPGGAAWTVTSTSPFTINFTVAPSAGTKNVVFTKGSRSAVAANNSLTYQGVNPKSAVAATISYFTTAVPNASERLYGASLFGSDYYSGFPAATIYDVTGASYLLNGSSPLMQGGQLRLHTQWLIDATASNNVLIPAPLQGAVIYDPTTNDFYKGKTADYISMAGFGDAGNLPTQAKNNTGGLIVDLSAVNSSIVVAYAEQSQLWTVYADQLLNKFEDSSQVGSGNHTGGTSVKFYHESLFLSARGLRLVSAGNFSNTDLEDSNIGEAIEEFQGYNFVAGCFWAYTGEMVCALDNGSTTELHVFDYSKNSKISSWSKWESSALGQIMRDGLLPLNGKLYYVTAAGSMFYFDADATDRQYDLTATAYTSTAQLPLLDMDQPGLSKVFESFNLAASGTWSIGFNLLTDDVEIEVAGPSSEGSSYGKGCIDLSMEGQAVGVVIRSTGAPTDSGVKDSVIQVLQIDYQLVRRS